MKAYKVSSVCQQVDDLMLYKYQRKLSEKMLLKKERETRVKFNPGLSATRPSNNWVQHFSGVSASENYKLFFERK